MKKIILLLLLLFPCITVDAQDYSLQKGKSVDGTYAGEEDYNYYQIKTSKADYLEITAKTSDKKSLVIDICDENKQILAENVAIPNNKTVLHKVENNKIYYLKIKGSEGVTYNISYKVKSKELYISKYAKKYNFIFTNASFNNEENSIFFKLKMNQSGILHFMCDTDDGVVVKYLDSKKKAVSQNVLMEKKALSGIGVQVNKTYYIKMWKPENTIEGTTTINNMKYQIANVFATSNTSREKAKKLTKGKFAETLVPAGNKITAWYKIDLSQKKKLKVTFESHLFQNNGKGIKLYICNGKGKALHKAPILITEEAKSKYKKKYKMEYPKKDITTGELPVGTYYIKIVSDNKKTSGSYKISWQ